jgi:hypothetical protein
VQEVSRAWVDRERSGRCVWVFGRISLPLSLFVYRFFVCVGWRGLTERDPASVCGFPTGSLFLSLSLSLAGVHGCRISLPLSLSLPPAGMRELA